MGRLLRSADSRDAPQREIPDRVISSIRETSFHHTRSIVPSHILEKRGADVVSGLRWLVSPPCKVETKVVVYLLYGLRRDNCGHVGTVFVQNVEDHRSE